MTTPFDADLTIRLWPHGSSLSEEVESVPAGARVVLDLTEIPTPTSEVVDIVRRLTGSARSVHVIGGERPATRALLVAQLLALGETGRGVTGRLWSGAEHGTSFANRGENSSERAFTPKLTWHAGMVLRDRDNESDDDSGHARDHAGPDDQA